MYRTIQHQMSIDDYLPPYEGELVQENRWVRLAQAIDWDAIEQEYSGHFAAGGKVAIPARMAFGDSCSVPHNGQRNGGDRARKPLPAILFGL